MAWLVTNGNGETWWTANDLGSMIEMIEQELASCIDRLLLNPLIGGY